MTQIEDTKGNDMESDEEMANNVLDAAQQPVTPIINQDTSGDATQQREVIQDQNQLLVDIEAGNVVHVLQQQRGCFQEMEERKGNPPVTSWHNDYIYPYRTSPIQGIVVLYFVVIWLREFSLVSTRIFRPKTRFRCYRRYSIGIRELWMEY